MLQSFKKYFLRINSGSGSGDRTMIKKCPVLGKLTCREDRLAAVARSLQEATVVPIVSPRMVASPGTSPYQAQKGQAGVVWAEKGRWGQV